MAWLEEAPLWLIWAVLATAFMLAQQVGYLAAHRLLRRPDGKDSASEGAGYLLSAALALLGLLIAFTFSMAADRYDARRQLVVEEANAVGTTYLRAQLLPEPARTSASHALIAYIDARREFFAAGPDIAAVEKADARTGALQTQIWNILTPVLAAQPQATINPAILQTTNETFDLASSDRAALDARVPLTILRTLVIYALISAIIMGSVLAASGRRHLIVSATVFVLVALAISLILDIDRPRSGTVIVSITPFARAAASIEAMEAAKAR
jgi:hypothetical protein